MSPLLRKEIRLILPFWGIAIVLAIVPVWIPTLQGWWRLPEGVYWIFAFGVMLLGLAPFGQEFGLGTFTSLLAQPFERRRFWNTKVLVVVIAAAVVFVAFMISTYARLESDLSNYSQDLIAKLHNGSLRSVNLAERELLGREEIARGLWYSATTGLLLLCVALTGGFWTTLLFRQTGAALWFAVLIPGVLIVVVQGIFHALVGSAQDVVLASVLILYSVAGVVWAWRMFAQAQDFQWLGETIAVFSLRSARKDVAEVAKPRRKAVLRALVGKEFQSHQISYLIAFGLLMLHVCTLIFRKFYELPVHSEFRFALEAVPLLWLLMPWLMGCVAIAEERKLGTMESQLCLPVRRRLQFEVKIAVVFILGVLIGGCMPCLIETVGSAAGVNSNIVPLLSSQGGDIYFATMVEMQVAAALIGLVSLFASSLTRNTLHALGAAIVFGLAWVFLYSWVQSKALQDWGDGWWKGPLILWVGAGFSVIATIGLSFSNYKRLHNGGRVWLRNVAVLAGTLVFAGFATAVVYQRPWELAMSLEPKHGAPVLSGAVRPVIATPGGKICVLLPDGRIWIATDYHMQDWDHVQEPWIYGENLWNGASPVPDHGTFVGSNWLVLAANDDSLGADAIRSDGTLWSILSFADATNLQSPLHWSSPLSWVDTKPNPRRIGSDSDWKKVISLGYVFMGVRSNGTLWQWNDYRGPGRQIAPTQVGGDSDWDNIFSFQWGPVLVKRDGSVWAPPMPGKGAVGVNRFVRTTLNGADWAQLSGAHNNFLVIKRDGSLWQALLPYGMVHFRNGSDWTAISAFPFVAVKGARLMKNGYVPFAQSLGRPSKYSDWIALHYSHDGLFALADDGTLCMWFDMPRSRIGSEWLARSHRPFWSVNLLTSATD